MKDVMAVEVTLADRGKRYFLTYRRRSDSADPEPVCKLVLGYAKFCSTGGEPVSARICETLRQAADSAEAPYFYEVFLHLASAEEPDTEQLVQLLGDKANVSPEDRSIWYCGRPDSA